MPHVTLQYFDGCPNGELADQRLRELQAEFDLTIEYEQVETPEEAERVGFGGSPSLQIDGIDPFATDDDPDGLVCRVYDTPDGPQGAPTVDQLRRALRDGAGA